MNIFYETAGFLYFNCFHSVQLNISKFINFWCLYSSPPSTNSFVNAFAFYETFTMNSPAQTIIQQATYTTLQLFWGLIVINYMVLPSRVRP